MVEAVEPPGDQEYPLIVLPEEATALAESVVLELEQVMFPLGLQLINGVETLDCNVVDAEAVQPLPDCVTVTVYVPAAVVVNEAPLPVGLHEYEAMDLPLHAVAVAETVRDGFEQEIGPLFEALTAGRQVSTTALHELLEVQPLDWVTVTV